MDSPPPLATGGICGEGGCDGDPFVDAELGDEVGMAVDRVTELDIVGVESTCEGTGLLVKEVCGCSIGGVYSGRDGFPVSETAVVEEDDGVAVELDTMLSDEA